MKFARTIRFDKSDLNIFPLASEEGELAVVGTFNFYNLEPEDLKGKVKQAFSNGFMGCKTFGYSTLVSLVNVSAEDLEELKNESADLLYHLIVLLQASDLNLSDVVDILKKRHAK